MSSAENAIKIEARDLEFYYGNTRALKKVNLVCHDRKVTAIIGPSGCGKSTLIRTINRMNDVIAGTRVEGKILLDGRDINAPDIDVVELQAPGRHGLSEAQSLPEVDLRQHRLRAPDQRDEEQAQDRGHRGEEPAGRRPLGRGQGPSRRERLRPVRRPAAASVHRPRPWPSSRRCILFDEPCSAIDPIATAKVEDLIERLKTDYTVVIVTHNMQQAARVSDYTAFMMLGELVEFDRTDKIFTNPSNKLTEDYITGRFG